MTVQQKRGFAGLALVVLLSIAALGAGTWYRYSVAQMEPVRITLVARSMAFVRPEDPATTNPDLVLPAGQPVEIEFRNEDPGALHDLRIPSLKLQTPLLKTGQSAQLLFTTPVELQALSYFCSRHPAMMRGEVLIGEAR